MKRVVKAEDLSKKHFGVDAGILKVKDGSYNIKSNNGANDLAPFNQLDPLAYWTKPTGAKLNAISHVLFSDGLGYFTYNGTTWVLDFFYASEAFIYDPPFKTLVARISITGMGTPVLNLDNILVNTTGSEWSVTDPEEPFGILSDLAGFMTGHYLASGALHAEQEGGGGTANMSVYRDEAENKIIIGDSDFNIGSTYILSIIFIKG